MITVMQPGQYTTVQDQGRRGYQAHGMPISGALDTYAFQAANILAGNDKQAAVLEMTGTGAVLKFEEAMLVGISGGNMQAEVNGRPVDNWSSFVVPAKGELRFQQAVTGYRGYLAVRGGIDVPVVMGSRSTYTGVKLGGLEGRTLRQGDVLYPGQMAVEAPKPQSLDRAFVPCYSQSITLRVLLGTGQEPLGEGAIRNLLTQEYVVAPQSDRSVCVLSGEGIRPDGKLDMISEAVSAGAIQLSPAGMPSIALFDHQPIRGFVKVGYVIQGDFGCLAQARPGDRIQFMPVTEELAVALLRREKQRMEEIQTALGYSHL